MGRSSKKEPFIKPKLLKKVAMMKDSGKQAAIKIYSRSSTIYPDCVGVTFAVHNGKNFIPVYITEDMVGHKLGEFSPTRNFKGHAAGKTGKK